MVGGVGGVCTVIFVSNPTTVLRLCCVVIGVVTIKNQFYRFSVSQITGYFASMGAIIFGPKMLFSV